MIKWPDIKFPPINLWNAPKLENKMSNEWEGGKGDRNRTENLRAWRENYDKIFGKRDLNYESDNPLERPSEPSAVDDAADVMSQNIECLTPAKKAVLERMENDAKERAVIKEILDFLQHIDLEEYPVQKAKELYKKYLTVR